MSERGLNERSFGEERCRICAHWFSKEKNTAGECRRNSPIALKADIWPDAKWPVTYPFDWCGDFTLTSNLDDLIEDRRLSESAK